MKGSDLLVSALENEGVERVFGLPGEENLDVVESLRRSSIELIVTRHEQAASFMAATQGRLTGRPGVCLTTLGPGALNLTTGAAFALLGAMPMIMLTGQKGILSRKQGRFQVVDIAATMAPLTKMAHQIVSPGTIPTTVREAFRLAQQERPGPVHLELPEDIAAEVTPVIPLVKPHLIDMPVADPTALDRAADLVLKAERPLLMLGAAANRPRGSRINCQTLYAAWASRSSTLKWAKAPSLVDPGSTWAQLLCRSATMCIGLSIAPISSSRSVTMQWKSRRLSWGRAVLMCFMSVICRRSWKRYISRMPKSLVISGRASSFWPTESRANCRTHVLSCRLGKTFSPALQIEQSSAASR
jgi:Thiamine pyrophosphate enzyme, N-terminal TPP binding domain